MKKLVLVVTLLAVVVSGAAPTAAFAENTGTVQQPIVGGHHAGGNEFPFIVALLDTTRGDTASDQQFCGGSLIDSDSVLTAAHCVDAVQPTDLQVGFGSTSLSGLSKDQKHDVAEIYTHPSYVKEFCMPIYNPTTGVIDQLCGSEPGTHEKSVPYDVAVLKLKYPLKGINPAVPASIDDDYLEEPGTLLTEAGWGNMAARPVDTPVGSTGEDYPDLLQWVNVPVVSDDVAGASMRGYDPSIMVGAGGDSKSGCQGDSGGPLFAHTGSAYVVVGIVSSGQGCGTKNGYHKFTEVNAPSISDFIQEKAALPAYKPPYKEKPPDNIILGGGKKELPYKEKPPDNIDLGGGEEKLPFKPKPRDNIILGVG